MFPPLFFIFIHAFVQVTQIKKITEPKFRLRRERDFGSVFCFTAFPDVKSAEKEGNVPFRLGVDSVKIHMGIIHSLQFVVECLGFG